MNEFIERLKEDSKLLLTLMLFVAAILLLFFFLWAGLVVFFFVALAIWVLFVFAYLRFLFSKSFGFRILTFVFLFFITFWLLYTAVPERFGGKSAGNSKNRKLVECTSTASATTSKVDGWNTYLFPADWTKEYTPFPKEKTAPKESYSFSNIGEKKVANIFYQIERSDRSELPAGTKRALEVCDVNNKTYQYWTTASTTTTDASAGVVASIGYMQKPGINEKMIPGDFRVDGYLFTNGKWTLTDRISKVHIVK